MMLEQQLHRKYVARNDDDVVGFIGKKRKLIVLEKPLENIPSGYTQVTMMYKGESHIVLIPEKAKYFMANPGEDGKPLDALDELVDFYGECGDFEHELLLDNKFSVGQTNISTLARKSYAVWAINQLVTPKKDGEPEWNTTELERLGITDVYVEQRLQGIAALVLGKKASELEKTGLQGILVHKNVKGTYTEVLTEKEFEQITCWAGSHYEIRPEYQNQGYTIEKVHDAGHKKGWKITHEREFTELPAIGKLEDEIENYCKEAGKETTQHDRALLRTYINLTYIAKENTSKQLDVMTDARTDNH